MFKYCIALYRVTRKCTAQQCVMKSESNKQMPFSSRTCKQRDLGSNTLRLWFPVPMHALRTLSMPKPRQFTSTLTASTVGVGVIFLRKVYATHRIHHTHHGGISSQSTTSPWVSFNKSGVLCSLLIDVFWYVL